jgi:ABC-type sugar transport system, periplasmic component
MKKFLNVALGMLLVVGLAACGNSNTSNANEITFALWGSSPAEVTAMENTIASFTAETGITVKKEVIEDKYMEVLKSRFAANNAPDVFYADGFEVPGLIKSGVLADVTAEIENPDDFYPSLINAFKADGKTYAFPKDYSTLSLYINTKLLADSGYSVEDVPTELTSFMKFAKELQGKLPEGVVAMLAEKDLARHLSAIEATGAEVITADGRANFSANPKVEEYLKLFTDGHAEGYIADAQTDLGAGWSGDAFGTGKAVMMFEGNWVLSALAVDFPDTEYISLELPKVNGNKHTMAFTVGYAVSAKTEKSEAAIAFANYMTNKGQQQWAEESGTFPTRQSVTATMKISENDDLKSHVAGAEYSTVWARGETLPIINTNFGNQFLAAFNGQEDLNASIKKIDEISNKEIENA